MFEFPEGFSEKISLNDPQTRISAVVSSKATGQVLPRAANVIRQRNGTITLDCNFEEGFEYVIHVSVGDSLPSEISQTTSVRQLDTRNDATVLRQLGVGLLSNPHGICISDTNVFVADFGKSAIHVFQATDGTLLRTFPDKVWNAHGICCDAERVYVTEFSSGCVQVFQHDGTHSMAIGCHGTANGQFHFPSGLCSHKGCIYIADCCNHRVQVIDSCTGVFIKSIGSTGSGDGQLLYPSDVTCDDNDHIYVADGNNHRVQIFTCDGYFIRSIGGLDNDTMLLQRPTAVCWRNDLLYVSDSDSIHVFDCSGALVKSIQSEGLHRGHQCSLPWNPTDICISHEGDVLYVSDGNSRVVEAISL